MTVRDLRMLYKRQTGRLPNGSYNCMDGHPINDDMDEEISFYIEWLEHVAATQLTLHKQLIPWEK